MGQGSGFHICLWAKRLMGVLRLKKDGIVAGYLVYLKGRFAFRDCWTEGILTGLGGLDEKDIDSCGYAK